eukprot:Skav203913  [mRNA]  locus=scaffold228:169390:172464:- [translate_table: standard]
MQALRRKKHKAARGLDAVSRADLMTMPVSFHEELLRMFQAIEDGQDWPAQWLEGGVWSLAKVQHAERIPQYRPITILPILYRIWSSLRAKVILRFLATLVPDGIKGNLPGVSSVDVWWELQSKLEESAYTGTCLTGAVGDLVKAFNLIPRTPIFCAARKLGIATNFLDAWSRAISSVRRRFFIADQPSQGLRSSTGFPEGDPLSVCSMTILNIVSHRWLELRYPKLRLVSYVDNLELLGEDPIEVHEGMTKLGQFIELFDMELDAPKTFFWSNSSGARKELRNLGQPLREHARDLGGHMQYVYKKTNVTVKDKCLSMQWLWKRLSRSRAPKHQKLKVLRQKAWPSALHAISTVTMSSEVFKQMRTPAVEAVYQPKAGANPMIQLSLVCHCMHDPECYAVATTVMQFRKYASVETIGLRLADVFGLPSSRRKPGPCAALASRLERLNWQWVRDTTFLDDEQGVIDIMAVPVQELQFRLHRSWCRLVGHLMLERDEFDGLGTVDVAHSRISAHWNLDEHSMLRVLQIGTFCTADKLNSAHIVESSKCKFCGCTDSLRHRHLECEATAMLRSQLPTSVSHFVTHAPSCVQRGWIPEPSSLDAYHKMLLQIPDDVFFHEPIPQAYEQLETWDFFIDGSARHPHIPCARLAAWAVVLAGPYPAQYGFPVARGYVMGRWQTVLRAELTAMLSALGAVLHSHKTCRIWVDNNLVFKRTRAIQRNQWCPTRMSTDHDLWMLVAELLEQVADRVTICKVASHQDLDEADEWELWAFNHNDHVDACAKNTFTSYLLALVAVSDAVATEWRALDEVKEHWHSYLVQVAKLSIQHVDNNAAPTVSPPLVDSTPPLDLGLIARHAHAHAPKTLRFPQWLRVLHWMERISENPLASGEWVTWYELLWSLQLSLGGRGVRSTSTNNTWAWDDALHSYDMQKSTRWLSSWLTQLIKLVHPGWKSKHYRPSCYRFQCWAMTVKVLWNRESKDQVHVWLQSQLGHQEITQLTQVQKLSEAYQEQVPPLQHNPCVGLHRYGFS